MADARMTAPALVFLHGVGNKNPDLDSPKQWKAGLERGLNAAGYPSLDHVDVIAPQYRDLLLELESEPTAKEKKRRLTFPGLQQGLSKEEHAAFTKRMAALERMLSNDYGGVEGPVTDAAQAAARAGFHIPLFKEAKHYMRNTVVRERVLNRVLESLPKEGSIVLVGHSLGSVIAADVLTKLPRALHIAGMVTVGSPLAQANFDLGKLDTDLKEPPANLEWWVNFWSRTDPVAAWRGAATAVPWLLDLRVPTVISPVHAHYAAEYLEEPLVGKAIGYALFGSQSKEIVLVDGNVDVPIDSSELRALIGLRLAHLTKTELEKGMQKRYAGALAEIQGQVVRDLIERRQVERRPIPQAIAELQLIESDLSEDVPAPKPIAVESKEFAAELLTVLALQNLLPPYEIEIKTAVKRKALQELSGEMQQGTKLGNIAIDAIEEASRVLAGKGRSLLKWGLVSAGALAVVATGGLILAPASAGLAGAAAITSGLAAFGPGGMIGGLITAGTLVSAGSSSIAVGILSSSSSAAEVERLIHGQLSLAILRKRAGLPNDNRLWNVWVETERELIREQQRINRFSDPNSEASKEIERKIEALQRAIDYAEENLLSPRAIES